MKGSVETGARLRYPTPQKLAEGAVAVRDWFKKRQKHGLFVRRHRIVTTMQDLLEQRGGRADIQSRRRPATRIFRAADAAPPRKATRIFSGADAAPPRPSERRRPSYSFRGVASRRTLERPNAPQVHGGRAVGGAQGLF